MQRAEAVQRWHEVNQWWSAPDGAFRALIGDMRKTQGGRDLLWFAESAWSSFGLLPPWTDRGPGARCGTCQRVAGMPTARCPQCPPERPGAPELPVVPGPI